MKVQFGYVLSWKWQQNCTFVVLSKKKKSPQWKYDYVMILNPECNNTSIVYKKQI